MLFTQPKTLAERVAVASACTNDLKFSIPCLLDDIDTAEVQKAYSGWPERFYVIDIDGLIAYKGGRGPGGFKPPEAEAALAAVLANGGKITEAQARGEKPAGSGGGGRGNRRRR